MTHGEMIAMKGVGVAGRIDLYRSAGQEIRVGRTFYQSLVLQLAHHALDAMSVRMRQDGKAEAGHQA